jgi:WD40 repeat protein/transcriptional regulator with XRE-family HTH domain
MAELGTADRGAEDFSGLLLRCRGRTRLTQRQLAERVGVNRRSVQDWEGGVNHPSAQLLRALIGALLDAGGLSPGHEAEEAEELWEAALRETTRMHLPFDRPWFDGLLARAMPIASSKPEPEPTPSVISRPDASKRRQDWGDAPEVREFVGRTDELALLHDWVLRDHCRLVGIVGIGGIGKTTLTARLARDVAPDFEHVYWRSFRNAPPIGEWLSGAIGFLSGQERVAPDGEAEQRAGLFQLLRERPSLLVLDNFETLLEAGQLEGGYRDGYAGYGTLLQALGTVAHRSCVVVTSREVPPELALLDGDAVRTRELSGLNVRDGRVLLAPKQLAGAEGDWNQLIDRYGGNGLALKVVGESIRQLFGGDISAFLEESGSGAVFGGIRRLLAEQLGRSSALERLVLKVLAVERDPVTITELLAALGAGHRRGAIVEAIEALRRRSLLERAETVGATAFTLQSVVLEYTTDRLVEDASAEIADHQPSQIVELPLIKAQAKDYVRQNQERLIGEPILQQLAETAADPEQALLALLDGWRHRPWVEQGYGPGNVVNLLRLLRGDLRGLNLGGLALRQAYLAGVAAQDTSLAAAHLSEAVLTDAFTYPISVALSGDGAFLVAGTSTGEVWLWRVADRTPLVAMQGHTGPIHGVAISSDATVLASGSEDGAVRLWSASNGQLLATLAGHGSGIRGVALSGDGRLLASGSFDGTVRLWEAPSGRLLRNLEGHTGPAYGVALSVTGDILASGSHDGTIRLWETASGRLLHTLQGHPGPIRDVALSADGRTLASDGLDGAVQVWNLAGGQPPATLAGHASGVWSVSLSADGRLLASGSFDGTIRLWEAPSRRLLATLPGHTSGVRCVAMSGDGRLLASSSWDGTIRLWETPSGRPRTSLEGYTGGVWGVSLSADGNTLATGSSDGTARIWDARSGQLVTTFQGHIGGVRGVRLSTDGRLLMSGGLDGTLRLWEVPDGRLLATLRGHTGPVYGVALSADKQLLATGSEDGTARLWQAAGGRLLATLEGHSGGVRSVAMSQDGQLLVSGSWGGSVRLWDVPSARQLVAMRRHTGPVYNVALSADASLVASGSEDGTVRLWDTAGQHLVATLEGHRSAVWGVALSADGRLAASGSWDGAIRLWEAPSGRPLAVLQGHASVVRGVALSADGIVLASGSFDGTIRVWDTRDGTCLHSLRSDRVYERVDIAGLTGVSEAQRQALFALGAVERPDDISVGGHALDG